MTRSSSGAWRPPSEEADGLSALSASLTAHARIGARCVSLFGANFSLSSAVRRWMQRLGTCGCVVDVSSGRVSVVDVSSGRVSVVDVSSGRVGGRAEGGRAEAEVG